MCGQSQRGRVKLTFEQDLINANRFLIKVSIAIRHNPFNSYLNLIKIISNHHFSHQLGEFQSISRKIDGNPNVDPKNGLI